MKSRYTILLFCLILVIAIVTRFYNLGKVPSGLYIDEAGQGYSAYSILLTGKDEFGKAYPAVFRSFTDFKTPVYIYTIVPLIPIFGLTPFTVRFPSFLFSVLTFPVLFLLLKKISPKSIAIQLSLVSVFLLAISPWHILFGRTNFECNLALFFLISGIYCFYLGLKKPYFVLISSILFAIAVPSYHSQRIITPMMVALLSFKYRRELFDVKHKKWTIAALISGLIISLPTLLVILTPGFLARAVGLNIFSLQRMPSGFAETYHGMFDFLINSRWYLSTQEFLSLYFSYFSPRYMFNLGDYGPRSSFPELPTFFVWEFPFYIYGLYVLIKNKFGELKFITLALLLISPIPAAVTRDPYSTIRSLPLVIPQMIVIGLGLISVAQLLYKNVHNIVSRKYLTYGLVVTCCFITLYSLGKLYSSVILLNEYYRAKDWDWGWNQVVQTITLYKNIPVVIDNSRNEPYIEVAFFLKFDPNKYQQDNFEVNSSDYYTNMVHNTNIKMDNIITRPINWEKDLRVEQVIVGDGLAISDEQIKEHNLILLNEIKYPNKDVAFRIVKTQPQIK